MWSERPGRHDARTGRSCDDGTDDCGGATPSPWDDVALGCRRPGMTMASSSQADPGCSQPAAPRAGAGCPAVGPPRYLSFPLKKITEKLLVKLSKRAAMAQWILRLLGTARPRLFCVSRRMPGLRVESEVTVTVSLAFWQKSEPLNVLNYDRFIRWTHGPSITQAETWHIRVPGHQLGRLGQVTVCVTVPPGRVRVCQ